MTERPGPLQIANLVLLLALALALFAPLLGFGRVPLVVIVVLFVLRLAVQLLRARREPQLRRPLGWLLDVVLIVLLLSQWSAS